MAGLLNEEFGIIYCAIYFFGESSFSLIYEFKFTSSNFIVSSDRLDSKDELLINLGFLRLI